MEGDIIFLLYAITALIVSTVTFFLLWKYETGKRRERDEVIASLYARMAEGVGVLKGEG